MSDIYGPLQVVLHILGPLSTEVSLHYNLNEDVNSMKNELQYILGRLMNAEERAEGDDAAKDWLKRVREFAFDTEDAIERFQLYRDGNKISRIKHYVLRDVSAMAYTIKSLRQSAASITGAGDRFMFTNENGTHHGQHNNNQAIPVTFLNPCTMTAGYEVVEDDVAKREIINLLGIRNITRTPSTIAVVGMRGLGKTTVVQGVYYDNTIRSHFPLRAWISMSECRQEDTILRSMIIQFSKATRKPHSMSTLNNIDEGSLQHLLQKYIKRKRYMVVFDNVQEGDVELTKNIKALLETNKEKSKILITARYENTAHVWLNGVGDGLYKLKPLPPNRAWELFCKTTFHGSGIICPPTLQDLACGIVQKCGGLPPVIIAVGNLLSNNADDFNEWSKVKHSLGFYLDSNCQLSGINKAFMQSYYDLPFHLRPCFLYFGLFPEGYPIARMRLLRLWIAEGFIRQCRGNLTLEEVAEEYMNQLINMSMVEVKSRDPSGKVQTLGVVSTFLHEMILSKLHELRFCKIISKKGSSSEETCRRLSIYEKHESQTLELENITRNPSSIRSLFVENVEQPIMVKILDNKFLESISLLKVLDLFNAPIESIPKEVGKLLNLHYLSLRSTRVSRIPKSIGKLEKLQTLDLKQTFISELPKELIKLHNLRHLLGYYYKYDISFNVHCMKILGVKMPEGLPGNWLQLQKLTYLDINTVTGHRNWATELRNLTQLRKLGIIGLQSNEERAMCSVIDVMKKLQSFSAFSRSKTESINLRYVKSPPVTLKRLYLSGRLVSLPIWTYELHSLVKIRLRWSNLKVDPLGSLQLLPNLVELQLLEACTLEHLTIESHGFQKLKVLQLLDLHPLKTLTIVEGALPLLDAMSIGESKHLEVPSTIKYLSTLTTLNFYNMPSCFTDRIRPGELLYSIVKHIPSVLFYSKGPKGNLEAFTLR